jgi:hypothetical protein
VKTRKASITFKRQPERDGMMMMVSSYQVNYRGKEIARIQGKEYYQKPDEGLWFWYAGTNSPGGEYVNTCDRPASLAECKAEIKEHFKGKLED